MKKVILLCQQKGCSIEISPARYQLIHELNGRGYEIYLLFRGSVFDKTIKSEIHHFVNTMNLTTKDIRHYILDRNPNYIFAFTYEDAKILFPIQKKMKESFFVYYNLEIYTLEWEKFVHEECRWFNIIYRVSYFINKIEESLFAYHCDVFVIQDELRKKVSRKFFVWNKKTLLIPNTYFANEEVEPLKNRVGIINSGGLCKRSIESMFENLNLFPDIQITFAGWSDGWFEKQYKRICKSYTNITYYNQKLLSEEYTTFLNKYAVGLVWYSPTKDANMNYVGLSSGKLFKHLSISQPVIVVDYPGISETIKKYKLGVVINDLSELSYAYDEIMNNYTCYMNNIKNVYDEIFDYKKLIIPLFKIME